MFCGPITNMKPRKLRKPAVPSSNISLEEASELVKMVQTPPVKKFSGKYRFLSNFYTCPVEFGGIMYKSSEHAFQAAKSTNTSDRKKVRNAKTAGEAKKLGRQITLRPDWEKVKLDVMYQILADKFSRNKDLRIELVNTGDAHLEEGNTWGDTFWGTVKGVGKNHLGKTLMRIRKEIWEGAL